MTAPTLRRFAGRCPPRGLTRLGAALRRVEPALVSEEMAPMFRRFAGRCPPRRLTCLGASLRRIDFLWQGLSGRRIDIVEVCLK